MSDIYNFIGCLVLTFNLDLVEPGTSGLFIRYL